MVFLVLFTWANLKLSSCESRLDLWVILCSQVPVVSGNNQPYVLQTHGIQAAAGFNGRVIFYVVPTRIYDPLIYRQDRVESSYVLSQNVRCDPRIVQSPLLTSHRPVILQLRLFALYHLNRKILAFMVTAFAVTALASGTLVIVALGKVGGKDYARFPSLTAPHR